MEVEGVGTLVEVKASEMRVSKEDVEEEAMEEVEFFILSF